MGELKKLRIAGTENEITPYTAADDTVVIANHTIKVNTNKIATKTELDGKVDKETGKGLSTNDFTTAEKNKLAGIEAQANKTVVDDELSDESENPVQNKVIAGEIGDLKAEINQLSESIAPVESTTTATAAHAVGELFMVGETLMVALSAIAIGDTITTDGGSPNAAVTTLSGEMIKDVQVNGTSVVNQGVANVPKATSTTYGVLKYDSQYGILFVDGVPRIVRATDVGVQNGSNGYSPITPSAQHLSTFYGLAKAAGDTTQKISSNPVGTYTDAAKKAIREMLGIPNMNGELITTVTVAENSESVVIDTDSNGQPFSLRVAKIQVSLAASTTGNSDNVGAQYRARKQDNTLSGWKDAPTLKMLATTKSILDYEFESYKAFNFLRAVSARETGATSDTYRTMLSSEEYEAVEQFKVYQFNANSTLIPAGTVIKIYGVRV